tara:strand:+ start:56 stop:937 length:882 start_codon:yes stop_codon:yes gene_type:complete
MSSFLKPPAKTEFNVLNLGAGVQSSALALMAAIGEIKPMPDFAVFADTMAEPQSVYDWLNWLESQVPFPIYRVTNGDLTSDSLNPTTRKREGKNGEDIGSLYMKRLIPVFGIMPDGSKTAAIGRKCTADYKIKPILKKIKDLCNIKRGQKEITVTQWIGISWDELQRMKDPSDKWTQHRWPLIERQITRRQCKEWMSKNNYPEPPRSACYYCPFHSDDEWRRLRNDDPSFFKQAVSFDKQIREKFKKYDKSMKMEVYLHNSCKPLDQVDFDTDEDKGQQVWDFKAECEGMCGL